MNAEEQLAEIKAELYTWLISRNDLSADCRGLGISSSSDGTAKWGLELAKRCERLRTYATNLFRKPMRCDTCYVQSDNTDEFQRIQMYNGVAVLCHQCLADINNKNPELIELRKRVKLLDELIALANSFTPPTQDAAK